jgi:glycine cleavage system H protein
MSYPENLSYTKEHEWILKNGSTATVGITKFAIDQLGDVVHIELPKVGSSFKAGDAFGTIESTKTVSDLFLPVNGTVTEVNADLANAPELIGEDPHGKYWVCKVTFTGEPQSVMTAKEYETYIAEQANH